MADRFDPPVRDGGLAAILGLVGAASPRGPGAIAGIEQEYAVWDGDRPVDFRTLLARVLPEDSLRRFAFDAHAAFVRSGAIWTADPPHAEIATAPRRLRRGIAGRLARDALAERRALLLRLRSTAPEASAPEVRGYSTHLNVFADGLDGWRLARHFLSHYGPAVLLLAERAGSPGLLVRPRPKRLEVGTEYLDTFADLVSTMVVALAGTIASWHALAAEPDGRPARSGLGSMDASGVQATWQRPGLFVPHDAFGETVDRRGRSAVWHLGDGRTQTAGDRLKATWEDLRPIAEPFCLPEELALVDARVSGDHALPLERGEPIEPRVGLPRNERPRTRRAPFTPLLRTHQRGRIRLLPELLTWDLAVLRVEHPTRAFYLRLPTESASRFEASWSSGRLDEPLRAFAASPPAGRVARLDETAVGLFDEVEAPSAAAARMGGPKQSEPAAGKKRRTLLLPPTLPPPTRGRRRWGWIWLVGVVLTTVIVLGDLPGLPGAEPTPTPSAGCLPGVPCPTPGPSLAPSACPIGFGCGSPAPTQSGQAPSVGPTSCPPGTVCGTPAPSPSPAPSPTSGPTPSPRPPPRPTPTPDTTPPSIGRIAWTPGTISNVPPVGVPPCGPESVTVTVVVKDPSGVKAVTLRYQRAGDASPISVAMTLSAGRYRVTLSTATSPAAWQPSPGDSSYVVRLSIRAVDSLGNARTTAAVNGFTVTGCP